MNDDKPITTLYMLISVDGKISTGANDELDVDKDFPIIDGLKEGLHQYYENRSMPAIDICYTYRRRISDSGYVIIINESQCLYNISSRNATTG